MAVQSKIDFKGFDVDAYVCLAGVGILKNRDKNNYEISISINIFKDATKEHYLNGDCIVFSLNDLFDLTKELLWSKIKEKYQGTDLI